jgi:glycerol kinase
LLAGLGAGIWQGFPEVEGAWKQDRVFSPQMNDADRGGVIKRWKNAVAKA